MNSILGVPFSYDLDSPKDEIKLHPDVFVKLLECASAKGITDVYRHYNGTISIGAPECRMK